MANRQRTVSWRQPRSYAPQLLLGAIPALAFAGVTVVGDVELLTTFHVWIGTLWTLLVLVRGFAVAPLLDSRDDAACVRLLSRVVPLTVACFPVLALATIGAGLELALTYDLLARGSLLIWTVLALSGLILLVSLGAVFPTDIRLYRRLRSQGADHSRTAWLGTWNARLLTVQGTLQVMLLFLMTQMAGRVG